MTSPLLDPADLRALLASDRPPILLDVRWRLDVPDGRAAYEEGHIPGARYVSLDDELAAHGRPEDGRHPLPAPADFEQTVRAWGVEDGDTVVVYDDWQTFGAARAWWMLTDAGVPTHILNGGLAGWKGAGFDLAAGPSPEAGDGSVTLTSGQLPQLDIDAAADLPAHGVLLDARAGDRYRGENEPIDPRAGHIPGALSAPTGRHSGADGRFLPADELRRNFAALGIDAATDVGVYCGSGVSAAHTVVAMTVAGFRPALYPGSWSQWSNQPDRPAAVGPTP